jgi:hypothetical protein
LPVPGSADSVAETVRAWPSIVIVTDTVPVVVAAESREPG